MISGQRWFKIDILTGERQLTHQRGSGLGIPSTLLLPTSQRTSQPVKQDKWEKQELKWFIPDPQLEKFSFGPSRNLNKCFVTTGRVSVYTSVSSRWFVARMKPSSSISWQIQSCNARQKQNVTRLIISSSTVKTDNAFTRFRKHRHVRV